MTDPVALMVSHLEHKARCMHSGVPGSGVRIEHHRIGAASLVRCVSWPHDIGFNRAYGVDAADRLAVQTIATEFAKHGLRPLLEVSPETIDASASAHLTELGLQHLWDLTEAMGDAVPADDGTNREVVIRRMLPSEAGTFAVLAVDAYEFSPTVRPQQLQLMESACRDPQSQCLVGAIAGVACAIGIMTRIGDVAILNGGATMPAYRRRGLQVALLSQRIRQAHELGVQDFYVRAMAGSISQRNLERVGLRPRHQRQVWGHPLPA